MGNVRQKIRLPLAELRDGPIAILELSPASDAETVRALDRSQQPRAREGTAVTTIDVVTSDQVDIDELIELYDSVGWSVYTRDVGTLRRALAGSSTLVIARDSAVLIGLARVVSDNATICYLQDVLVKPSHQGHGVGRALVQAALEPYANVRQKVLLTDDEPAQRRFYESLGYSEAAVAAGGPLRAFVRFD